MCVRFSCNPQINYLLFKFGLNFYQIIYTGYLVNVTPVGQLYEDKSLALRARDLIFFTTDLQTVNYYSTIHCWSWSIS